MRGRAAAGWVVLVGMTCLAAASARAQSPVMPPAAAPPSETPVVAVAPAIAEPAPAPAVAPPAVASPAAPPPVSVGPIATADAVPAASDHDAVVGRVGVTARRVDTGPAPLTLRPGLGCPAGAACTVTVGAVGARYWTSRNLALNGALALASGGGSSASASLDTYLGVGPIAGLSVLLGNWRHLSVLASPELAFIWFRPAGSHSPSTVMFQMQAAVEAELHFGFIGVPALSIGLLAGAAVQYQDAPDAHVWTVGVIGGGSVWNALTSLSLRYYL